MPTKDGAEDYPGMKNESFWPCDSAEEYAAYQKALAVLNAQADEIRGREFQSVSQASRSKSATMRKVCALIDQLDDGLKRSLYHQLRLYFGMKAADEEKEAVKAALLAAVPKPAKQAKRRIVLEKQ